MATDEELIQLEEDIETARKEGFDKAVALQKNVPAEVIVAYKKGLKDGTDFRDAERLEKKEERLKEIIGLAHKLKWIMPKPEGFSYPPMQLSEVEKCMLAMIDDVELNQMRRWVKFLSPPKPEGKEGD